MARTVVINIDIDLEEGIRSVEDLLDRQADLKQLQIELQEEAKALRKALREVNTDEATEDQIEDYEKLARELVKVENNLKEVRQAQRLVGREFDAANTGEESYRRLAVEAAKLEAQLKKLNPGDVGFDDLKKQVEDANQAIIDFDQSINNGRTNVGRYTQSFIKAMEQAGVSTRELDKENFGDLQKSQKELISQISKLGQEYKDAGNIGEKALKDIERQIENAGNELKEVNSLLKQTESRLESTSKFNLSKVFEGVAANFTAGALLDTARNAISSLQDYGSELLNIRNAAGTIFADQAEDLDEIASKAQATANVFGKDYTDVLRAANTLSEEFGIKGTEAVEKVNNLLLRGADLSDNFLNQVEQYSTFFAQAGEDADDFLNILIASENAGIFDDKAADSIKEAFLSIREGTQATRDAFTGLGLDYEKEIEQINSGNSTFNDLLIKVSERLQGFDTLSPEVGAALADIFRGAGEDAGTFVQNLGQITDSLQQAPDALTPFQQAQETLVELRTEINQVAGDAADNLLPVAVEVLKIAKDLAVFIKENSKEVAIFSGTLITLVAAIKAVNVATNLYKNGALALARVQKALTVAQKALNLVMRANPIGLVVTAVLLLVGAFASAASSIDGFKNKVDAVFASILSITDKIPILGRAIRFQFEIIRGAIGFVLDLINNFPASLAGLQAASSNILSKVVNGFLSFGNTVQLVFQRVRSALNIGGIFGDDAEIDREIQRLEGRADDFAKAGTSVSKAYADARQEYIKNNPVEENVLNPDESEAKASEAGSRAGRGFSRALENELKTSESSSGSIEIKVKPDENSLADFENRLKTLREKRNTIEINTPEFENISEQIKKIENELKVLENPRQIKVEVIEEDFQRTEVEIKRLLASQEITAEEAERRLVEARKQTLERILSITVEGSAEYLDLQKKLFDLEIEENKRKEQAIRDERQASEEQREEIRMKEESDARKREEERRKLEEDRENAITQTGAAITAISDLVGAEEEAAERRQRIQERVTQVEIINSQRRIIQQQLENTTDGLGAILKGAKVPFPANLIAIATVVAAIARGIGAIRRLTQLEEGGLIEEKAARGMLLKGKRHSQGGIPIRIKRTGKFIEAEGGELVMTRGVYSDRGSRDVASALNELRGGVRFPGVSSNYSTVIQNVSNMIGGTPSMKMPALTAPPLMVDGGLLGSGNEVSIAGTTQKFDELIDATKENTEAVRKTKIAIPVRDVRNKLSALETDEARRR